MHPLQNEFIRQLSLVVLGTLFFMANCAFILIPSALGSTPGRPLPVQHNAAAPAPAPDIQISRDSRLAIAEHERRRN